MVQILQGPSYKVYYQNVSHLDYLSQLLGYVPLYSISKLHELADICLLPDSFWSIVDIFSCIILYFRLVALPFKLKQAFITPTEECPLKNVEFLVVTSSKVQRIMEQRGLPGTIPTPESV